MIYLDKLIHFFYTSNHNLNKKVILKNYIKKKIIIRDKEVLCIFCPPWHVGGFATSVLRYRIKNKNYSYLTYNIHPHVLSADYKSTKRYMDNVIKTISDDVNYYKQKYSFKKIYIFGISLGCLYSFNTAVMNKNINKVILAAPGYTLADSIWSGYSTEKLKEYFINNNLSLEKLEREWASLSPYKNIKNLKDTELTLLISKRDVLTKYESSKKLIKILKDNKIKLNLDINKNSGHYGTVIRLLVHPKKYM